MAKANASSSSGTRLSLDLVELGLLPIHALADRAPEHVLVEPLQRQPGLVKGLRFEVGADLCAGSGFAAGPPLDARRNTLRDQAAIERIHLLEQVATLDRGPA